MRRAVVVAGVALALALGVGLAVAARDTEEGGAISLQVVARGLAAPLHLAAPRSEPNRLYVVEQPGRIRVLENGRLRAEPFLDIRSQVQSGGEQGLLGLAFHPSYATNRRFYVDYTDLQGNTRIVEYRSNGRKAIAASRRQLFFLRDPYSNHNGGNLVFGPDGLLYAGMGDGGSGGDPENRAQNPRSLFGKLLTFDVNRRGSRPRIAAVGLRNPWRFSFDRANGDLYIGDVGQNGLEEIDYLSRRSQAAVENYGWDVYEGRNRFEQKRPSPGRLVFPIAQYGRGEGYSVTGGFVYRGARFPALRGRYFYGDFGSGTIWSLRVSGGEARDERKEPITVEALSSFGEDARGELYAVSLSGTIYRIAG